MDKKERLVKASVLAAFMMAFAFITGAAGAEAAPVAVQGQGFTADFYAPAGSSAKTGVLVLGGSEGGKPEVMAKSLVEAGYPVLCIAYFNLEGLPQTLEEIPLEYFYKAISWMIDGGKVKKGGIAVVGGSKGAELALLLASRRPEIIGVVARAPSSVVWQGLPKSFWPLPQARSSWSEGGKPLPFVPYSYDGYSPSSSLVELYRSSLEKAKAAAETVIPVERINGPLLLLSGADDKLWPSSEMAAAIVARLKAKGFSSDVECVVYPDAGHTLNEYVILGGTPDGNRKARLDSEARTLEFLARLDAMRDRQ
jgi:uncharacterized protein